MEVNSRLSKKDDNIDDIILLKLIEVNCKSGSVSSSMTSKNICKHSNKNFISTGNLNKHIKNVHKIDAVAQGTIQCREQHCSFSCTEIRNLRDHLKAKHQFKMEEEKLIFTSLDDL